MAPRKINEYHVNNLWQMFKGANLTSFEQAIGRTLVLTRREKRRDGVATETEYLFQVVGMEVKTIQSYEVSDHSPRYEIVGNRLSPSGPSDGDRFGNHYVMTIPVLLEFRIVQVYKPGIEEFWQERLYSVFWSPESGWGIKIHHFDRLSRDKDKDEVFDGLTARFADPNNPQPTPFLIPAVE